MCHTVGVQCAIVPSPSQDFYGGGEGGAFHNRGDVVVHGEANFTKNFGGVSLVPRVTLLETLNEHLR